MLTLEEYQEKLKEIVALNSAIILNPDPVNVGLSYFNETLAQLQACRERASTILTEALWNRAEVQCILHDCEKNYEDVVNRILSGDKNIAALKSDKLRLAHVAQVATQEANASHEARKNLYFAEAFLKSVQAIDNNLEAKNDNLVQQMHTVRLIMHLDPDVRDAFRGTSGGGY